MFISLKIELIPLLILSVITTIQADSVFHRQFTVSPANRTILVNVTEASIDPISLTYHLIFKGLLNSLNYYKIKQVKEKKN